MKRVKGLAIQVPSRPGVLRQIYQTFENENITFTAIMAPDTLHSATLHILAEPLDRARETLNQMNFPFSIEEMFHCSFPDDKKLLGELVTILGIAKINIEFMFASNLHSVIFTTNDVEKTEQVLKENFLPKLS